MFTLKTSPLLLFFLFLFFIFNFSVNSIGYTPSDEQPTDISLWTHIQNANFTITHTDNDSARIEIVVSGNASSGTHHCGIAFVTQYKDGSSNYNGLFMEGPIETMHEDYALIFQPINNTWTSWNFYSLAFKHENNIGISKQDIDNISSFDIWIRVYGDEDGLFWNQTCMNLTSTVVNEVKSFYGISEGFQLPLWIIAIFVVFILIIVRFFLYIHK